MNFAIFSCGYLLNYTVLLTTDLRNSGFFPHIQLKNLRIFSMTDGGWILRCFPTAVIGKLNKLRVFLIVWTTDFVRSFPLNRMTKFIIFFHLINRRISQFVYPRSGDKNYNFFHMIDGCILHFFSPQLKKEKNRKSSKSHRIKLAGVSTTQK